jgi:signal transduction histidine kinase
LEITILDRVITITVSDNGIGISAEALPHIFDLFVQDTGALTRASGGLGIGLAVVRDLVIAHGGTVAGYSAGRNLGSKFVVTLPWSDKTSASVGSIDTAMLDDQI